jgi:hypothetical protein
LFRNTWKEEEMSKTQKQLEIGLNVDKSTEVNQEAKNCNYIMEISNIELIKRGSISIPEYSRFI